MSAESRTAEPSGSPRRSLTGLAGLKVLSFESRRALEMAKLIDNFGGTPIVVPSMREVPLESNPHALKFAAELLEGRIDAVIFLTAAGTSALLRVIESEFSRDEFSAALRRVLVIARGPKPAAVLRKIGMPVPLLAREPNTWREVLQVIDELRDTFPIERKQIAIQEYGESNSDLLTALTARGAVVMPVPVYDWDLPEDLGPLRGAVSTIIAGEIDIMLFTTSVQVRHFMKIARELGLESEIHRASRQIFIASIGPVTSEELRHHGLHIDLEPSHPKMGILVKETAARSAELGLAKGPRPPNRGLGA